MKRRLPNTTIYLDTADFVQIASPIKTSLQVNDTRFVITADRQGTGDFSQTLKGSYTFENEVSFENEVTVSLDSANKIKTIDVSDENIELKVIDDSANNYSLIKLENNCITLESKKSPSTTIGKLTLEGTIFTVEADIYVIGDILPTLQASELLSIGSITNKFLNAYFSGTVDADTITASHYGEVNATKIVVPVNGYGVETPNIGTGNSNVDLVLKSKVVPNGNNASDIGGDGLRFNNIYATNLHGCIPTPNTSSYSEPEKGTIFLAVFHLNSDENVTVSMGTVLKINSVVSSNPEVTIDRIGCASLPSNYLLENSSISSIRDKYSAFGAGFYFETQNGSYEVEGEYKCLHETIYLKEGVLNPSQYLVALVMRIN